MTLNSFSGGNIWVFGRGGEVREARELGGAGELGEEGGLWGVGELKRVGDLPFLELYSRNFKFRLYKKFTLLPKSFLFLTN